MVASIQELHCCDVGSMKGLGVVKTNFCLSNTCMQCINELINRNLHNVTLDTEG